MEINQISYFLALSEELHFVNAARRCGVAQPSLSKAIRLLEEELGAPLFQRRPDVALTPLGRRIRPHFLRIVSEIDNVATIARNQTRAAKWPGRLTAGSSARSAR